jgi:hypothetical protein
MDESYLYLMVFDNPIQEKRAIISNLKMWGCTKIIAGLEENSLEFRLDTSNWSKEVWAQWRLLTRNAQKDFGFNPRKGIMPLSDDWSASCIFFEHPVTIRVAIPGFSSQAEAEKYSQSGCRLALRQGQSAPILVLAKNGSEYVVSHEQIKIYIDPPNMPRPLDSRDPDDFQVIMDSLDDPDSPYHLKEDDMIQVDWSFSKLAEVVGYVDSFSYLAYGSYPTDPSAAPLDSSATTPAQSLAASDASST